MTGLTTGTSNLYALLVGVDYYLPNRLPGGGYYPSLGGCVRDVTHVEEYLKGRLDMQPNQILKLTASNADNNQPIEPPEQQPTYENMVAKFKKLIEIAQPGDLVYIHYSGHGGRATTIYPQIKGDTGLDEALVPTDIGYSEARYLRDVELAYLLQEMVDKGLVVTVVLDSCHSGGATRGVGGAVPRGITTIDTTPRTTNSLVASTEQLIAAWGVRAAKPASGWLLEPKGYTLWAACRASESAYEYPFNGHESNGALTYWLLDSLQQAGPGFTYKMLHDRILAKVHSQFDSQTPQLQGEGNRVVFGSDRIQPHYAVPVLQVNMAGRRVRINAGEAHGVQVGTQFTIYPYGTTDFSQEGQRAALVEVTQSGPVDSWATIVEQFGNKPIEPGAQAVLLNVANVRLQRRVAVIIPDESLRQQVEAAIQKGGQGFVALAGPGDAVDFQMAVNDRQEYELWDPAGRVIPNIRPSIAVNEPTALSRIAQRLVHLAKYRNVQDLDMPDPLTRQTLQVELLSAPSAATPAEAWIFQPGDKIKLRVKNTQLPNPLEPNDPGRILNVTVLDLQADWGITQIYPAGAGAFESVEPGQTLELEFEAYLPEGYTESIDVIKIFATRATTHFRWLELPALDQPDTRAMKTRATIKDPLEQMLAGLTMESPTRAIRLTSMPKDHAWTVAQLELRVRA